MKEMDLLNLEEEGKEYRGENMTIDVDEPTDPNNPKPLFKKYDFSF